MTPLAGLRVLECGSGIGAAFCAKVLQQLGAETVKLRDRPPPESARSRAERLYLDHGKHERTAELGSEVFLEELRGSDVVVRGLDPAPSGVAPTLRTEYEAWLSERPGLVYVALTPFGTTGPAASWAGGDLHAQALSGWASVNGHPGEPPLTVGYGVGAIQQGLNAAAAAVAVLVDRGAERRGEFIDMSEAGVIATHMYIYSLVYRWSGIPLVRSGTHAPGSSGRYPHAIFPCQDGFVLIIARSEREWNRIVAMLGDPPWAAEPRYRDFYAMATQYPEEVDALITPWLLERTKAELWALATEHGVPLAPVRTAAEVLEDVQLDHRRFLTREQGVRLPGLPAIWQRSE